MLNHLTILERKYFAVKTVQAYFIKSSKMQNRTKKAPGENRTLFWLHVLLEALVDGEISVDGVLAHIFAKDEFEKVVHKKDLLIK